MGVAGHTVIQVGGVGGTGGEGFHCRVVVSGGVTQRNGTLFADSGDEGQIFVLFGGNGDQFHLTAAGRIQTVKELCIRFVQVFRSLRAALGVAQKRAFQMDTGTLGAAITLEIADHMHGGSQCFLLQRHRRR